MAFELTADEEGRLSAAFAALTTPTAEAMEAAQAASPRQLFCQYWPMVKQVLQFLSSVAPGPVKAAIALVIAAGDAASKIIC